jgi:hypothetical protein
MCLMASRIRIEGYQHGPGIPAKAFFEVCATTNPLANSVNTIIARKHLTISLNFLANYPSAI